MSRLALSHRGPPTPAATLSVAPTISGLRGGTLTATPGTWIGSSSVSAQWYADGVATGVSTLTYSDTDTSVSLEYRETALPGGATASAYDGAAASAADYSDDFNSYVDGTRLAADYNNGTLVNIVATATPHVSGWHFAGYEEQGDTNVTGEAQNLRIQSGKVQQTCRASAGGAPAVVRDFGAPDGVFDFTASFSGSGDERIYLLFSAAWASFAGAVTGLIVNINVNGTGTHTIVLMKAVDQSVLATITTPLAIAAGDILRVKLDHTAQKAWLYHNGVSVGTSTGYDVSTAVPSWTNKHGFLNSNGSFPAVGQNLVDAITYNGLGATTVAAVINNQSSGAPGKKQVDVTASIGAVGATGAQYKVETEAGALVQSWTAMSFASAVGTASFLIPDFSHEGERFRVLARNVGGTVNTGAALTGVNPYALVATMRVGLNDSSFNYWGNQVIGRDIFEFVTYQPQDGLTVHPLFGAGSSSHDGGIEPVGRSFAPYSHWDEVYNPAQNYPSTGTDDNYMMCVLNGVQWQRTSTTPRSGVSPNPSDGDGTVSGWRRAGRALASVVSLGADGWPDALPSDTNLTIVIALPGASFKPSRYPVTVHCKTEPGVNLVLHGNTNVTMTNQNVPAGTFDLTYSAEGGGFLYVDRSTPISSAFFASGIATYETGTPALDIGQPYGNADKLSDWAPFYVRRTVNNDQSRKFSGAVQGALTAANGIPAGGRREWKYDCDFTTRASHKAIWVNVHDYTDSTYDVAMAQSYFDNLPSTVDVSLERGNELWNGIFWAALDLNARAATAGITTLQLYCRELNTLVGHWKSVWGSSSRLKPVLAWQSTLSTADLGAALDFENTYQNVRIISVAPYFEGGIGGFQLGNYANTPTNIRSAVSANDQTTFNTLADAHCRTAVDFSVALMRTLLDFLPGYAVGKGLGKNTFQLASYEASQHIVVDSGAWDTGLGAGMGARAATMFRTYKRSATYAATHGYYIDQMAAKAPHMMVLESYVGDSTNQTQFWSHMERIGNTSDEPYATAKTKALAYNV